MKAKFFTLLVSLFLITSGMAIAENITLDHYDGFVGNATDSVLKSDGSLIVFHLRYTNPDSVIVGMTNGYRIYSDDGATWTETVLDTVSGFGWTWPGYPPMFDTYAIFPLIPGGIDTDGMLSDTVACAGLVQTEVATGFPAGFDDIAVTITIGPISDVDNGKHICLDSAFAPPLNTFKWNPIGIPTWGGPYCFSIGIADDVKSLDVEGLPTVFALNQNYPNPFNPSTEIKFELPTKSKVSIKIFNVLGQTVKNLVDTEMDAGSYVVDWDGTSEDGGQVSSGVYLYKMTAGNFTSTKKMVMLK